MCKDIVAGETREMLTEATRVDSILATARTVANQIAEGYHWVERLLFRTRLDTLGDNVKQLCLPTPYRSRCMSLAHESYGHAGRNKMCQHICRFNIARVATLIKNRISSCPKHANTKKGDCHSTE